MTSNSSGGLSAPQSWPRRAGAVAALAGVVLLAVACGGGNPSSTAGGQTYYQKAVAYAQCMRSHGVPSFPDPNSQGQFPPVRIGRNGVSQQAVQSAQNACRRLQPGGGPGNTQQQRAKTALALSFARCMRAHGVPNFPDPAAAGNGGMGFNLSGIDTHSPQFQSAQRACRGGS